MKKPSVQLSSLTILTMVFVSAASFTAPKKTNLPSAASTIFCESCDKNPDVALRTAMRKLWEDHITWTRNVVICLVDDAPGVDQASKRLLQNQTDIGNAVKPYYGEEGGKKLSDLLHDHITIAVDVIKAAKASNTDALNTANKKWSDNANDISQFLCSANPKWNLMDMKKMMNDHLKLTNDEVVQRIKKNYDADILAYDKVHTEILEMSDMLTEGIIKQFPDKFKKVKEKTSQNTASK
jgi:hypothetical protein